MKKLLFILFALSSTVVYGQQSIELGLNVGASSYLGDLKETSYTPTQNSVALGIQGRYNFDSRFAGRVALNYGTIQGDDSKSDDAGLAARNLSFRSRIMEMAFMGEVNILNFGDHRRNKQGKEYFRFTPYIFGGIAIFNFNPEARYNGQWYPLQPLGTEGQDVPDSGIESYSLTQVSIPLGAGLKLQLEPNVIISFEVGWRKTFTDYLDDVSGRYYDENEIAANNGAIAAELSYRGDEISTNTTNPAPSSLRGDSKDKDWYIMSNFSLSYKLFRNHGSFTTKY